MKPMCRPPSRLLFIPNPKILHLALQTLNASFSSASFLCRLAILLCPSALGAGVGLIVACEYYALEISYSLVNSAAFVFGVFFFLFLF
jgi:hypothetical protein